MSRALAERTAQLLASRGSRRDFLVRVALVGSAVMTAPLTYLLRPISAYAAVCGSHASCSDGYTVFCCSIYRGINRCPPGTFVGGWWKADNSAFCCSNGVPQPRYYIDCHPYCTCSDGCGSGFCSPSCVACTCRCGEGSCDERRVCCNYFRYGQCHQEIGCSGPVACRVVTCVPPYQLYSSCGSTSHTDNQTVSHTAPCLAAPCAP
ncbi:MAG: hypothetical protein M3N51_05885 [Actinomycetota bacterium]|nr:hypothetical protein [Actinomycetota bacterium]